MAVQDHTNEWPPTGAPFDLHRDEHWTNFDSTINAVSFGFVATAILISMFLVVAIFERFLRPFFQPLSIRFSPTTVNTICFSPKLQHECCNPSSDLRHLRFILLSFIKNCNLVRESMTDQEPSVSTEVSGIVEVKEWLAKTFEVAGKPVPEFQYTPRSVSHLHHLSTLSKAKDEAARLVARDFRLKASEYRSQAARIREILENVGLAQESLSIIQF